MRKYNCDCGVTIEATTDKQLDKEIYEHSNISKIHLDYEQEIIIDEINEKIRRSIPMKTHQKRYPNG